MNSEPCTRKDISPSIQKGDIVQIIAEHNRPGIQVGEGRVLVVGVIEEYIDNLAVRWVKVSLNEHPNYHVWRKLLTKELKVT